MHKFLFNYKEAIHPDCGKKVKIHNDIITTPFYTEKFCDQLVKLAKLYDKRFSPYIVYEKSKSHQVTKNAPWDTLFFSRISHLLFEDFCVHYKKYICPVLEKHFFPETISGWFSPFIIKYSHHNQYVSLHNDTSLITLNVKLNTDYQGSILEFPRQNWTNEDIPKGWCYFWPGRVTHPHRATPLTKGSKYTLASWTHPVGWLPGDMGGSIRRDVQK
jgi:hypothetical protein